MSLRRWLVVGGLVVAAAAISAALAPMTVLQVENAGAGRSVRLSLHGGRFAVTYHHSMYDQPVTEEFTAVHDGTIRLRAVSSPSAAVREYFGITTAGERHEVDRSFRELVFRVAAGDEQRLRIATSERSFLDFGAHGDRLVMRALRAPALTLLLHQPSTHP